MSTVNIRNLVRCFCSFLAKRTDDNIFVCGRYTSGSMVCLFHLHYENLETYYQSNIFPIPLDCDMCLATIKIHSKEYIAPCRIPSVRCPCGGGVATFYQSKKDNANSNKYFFGCPKWKSNNCEYFCWSHKYETTRDAQILGRLIPPSIPENQTESRKRVLDEDTDEINKNIKKLECAICLSGERTFMITPCNHICCCSTCAGRIERQCPICRDPIQSIQRIFFA